MQLALLVGFHVDLLALRIPTIPIVDEAFYGADLDPKNLIPAPSEAPHPACRPGPCDVTLNPT